MKAAAVRVFVCCLFAGLLLFLAGRPAAALIADPDARALTPTSGSYRYTLAGRVRLLLLGWPR